MKLKDVNNHWVILQVIDNTCNPLCQDNMYMLRQINTALGKDMGRVKRYLLNKNTDKNAVYLDNYPKVILLDRSETLYNSLTKMDERIFIADPFGKIILGSHGGECIPEMDIPRYMKLLINKKINFKGLVTSRYSLNDINIAIDKIRSGASSGRILIDL